ncbi:MAG: hypothetical protein C0410_07890 [Anaerolinea sp.]|nr:hypothetical protein [Anaerolinea sp.]
MKKKADQIIITPEQLHKKQALLQVLLPVIAVGVICLGVCLALLLSTSSEPQSTEQWAQISTMFLIVPTLFIGLAGLAVLILLGIVIGKWNKNWPPALRTYRLMIINLETSFQGLVQKLAQPVIGFKSILAGILSLFKK